jgi:hypothetical protein
VLQAAAEIAGSKAALAGRLGVGEELLAAYLADRRRLPDLLLLRAVDIILADRQSQFSAVNPETSLSSAKLSVR